MHEEVGIIIRKLKGARSGKKLPAHASGEEIQGPKQISVSQLGYNDQLDNFDKLIRQLEMVPQYAPNEADLTVTALREYWNAMDTANKAALKADNDLSNCRLTRNNEFYAPESGLTEVAKADKLYIKALFGANSPQYHQLSGIPFRTYKN